MTEVYNNLLGKREEILSFLVVQALFTFHLSPGSSQSSDVEMTVFEEPRGNWPKLCIEGCEVIVISNNENSSDDNNTSEYNNVPPPQSLFSAPSSNERDDA